MKLKVVTINVTTATNITQLLGTLIGDEVHVVMIETSEATDNELVTHAKKW